MFRSFFKRTRHWLIPSLAGFVGGFIGMKFFKDDRVIVEDSIIGAQYELVAVDGAPVERIKHGIIVTRVPLALVEPGERVLTIIDKDDPTHKAIEYEVNLFKGFKHRLDKAEDGTPSIVLIVD